MYVITKVYTAKTASKQVYGGIMVSSKEDGSLPCLHQVKKGIHSRTKLARVRLILDVSDLCSKHNEANHKRFSNTP